MGIQLTDYYDNSNIQLSDERIEELLIQYLDEFADEQFIFNDEIKDFISSSPISEKEYVTFKNAETTLSKNSKLTYQMTDRTSPIIMDRFNFNKVA